MLLDDQEEFEVGQRQRLTIRLKGLIRQYQRGPGIIKEFIQNADDAGSEWVRIVMDWRDHRTGSPEEAALADVLGPALLIANGSVFTDSNFEAIQRIGESDKRLLAAKTGQFGLGFNTAYNVTDYPSLVSRDRMYCFDPHEGPVAPQHRTGFGLRLPAFRRRIPAWHAAFCAGGLSPDAPSHNGTIFRLPLRGPERAAKSEISREPFDRSDIEAILAKLVADGPAMLLFTRNVLHLSIEEVPANGGPARSLLDIRTENADEVAASRKTMHVPPDLEVKDFLEQLETEWVRRTSHRHVMRISQADETAYAEWHVCKGFYTDPDGELLSKARRMLKAEERAIPDAGIAIRLERRAADLIAASECEGIFCCGLPLPARTGLPLHVNGCFDLDDSRTKPTTAGATGERGEARAEWNEALLALAIPQAYADALNGLPKEVKEADPEAFYRLWPGESRIATEVLGEAVNAIHSALADRPLFRCLTSDGADRVTFEELDILPADAERALVDALVAQGLCVPDPALPAEIRTGAEAAGIDVNLVTPTSLRQLLKLDKDLHCRLSDAPHPALRRRDWLEAIVRFLVRDDKLIDLTGLPIALLQSGGLATFGLGEGGRFSGTEEQRAIFKDYPHWFVDQSYISATGLLPQPKAKFFEMSPKSAVAALKWPLPKIGECDSREWDAGGKATPNAEWLALVLEYLSANAASMRRDDFKEYPLIPDQHGQLHTPYCPSTPLIRPASRKLTRALEALRLPLVTGPDAVVDALQRLSSSLPHPCVWKAEGLDLLDTLHAYADQWAELHPRYDSAVHDPILDALSEESCIDELDDERLEKLRTLRILPTDDGRVVDAGEQDFYLPTDEEPPPVSGPIHLAHVMQRWRPLLDKAGIRQLDLPTLIQLVLLPAFPGENPDRQLELLTYIRTNLDRALQQEAENGGPKALLDQLGSTALIHGVDGRMHAAKALFSPDVLGARDILGNLALFPDVDFYPEPRRAWLNFFRSLGVKEHIAAADLVDRIDAVTSGTPGPNERRQIGVIFAYIQKNWDDLKSQRVPGQGGTPEKLPDALKRRQWLAAATQAALPGFAPPEQRFFKPTELYPLARGHLVAGEAPLLAGQSPSNEFMAALGIPSNPDPDTVLRRFDRLIDLAGKPAGEASRPDELKKSFDEIYRFLGRASGHAPSGVKLGATLRARYADRRCIWDHGRRRLIRPRDAFSESVPFFEPLKVRVTAEAQVAAGLDALGRRDRPDAADFRDFLDLLMAQRLSEPCSADEQRQALHALERIGHDPDSDVVDADLPILTQSGRLLPIQEVFRKDNPAWSGRITDTDLEFAHAGISGHRILSEIRRLSSVVTETLAEAPVQSADRELQGLCHRLETLMRSAEFTTALQRLANHEQGFPIREFDPEIDHLEVRPAVSIRTVLVLSDDEGQREIGGGDVDLFVDRGARRVWIATRSPRSVRPKLAKALNQILGDFALRDLAPLEAILGRSRDEMEAELDDRGIMQIFARPAQHGWEDEAEPEDPSTSSDSDQSDPSDDLDDTLSEDEDEPSPQPGAKAKDDTEPSAERPTGAREGGAGPSTRSHESPRTGTSRSGATTAAGPARGAGAAGRSLEGSDAAPPVSPGTGSSHGAGSPKTESAGRQPQEGGPSAGTPARGPRSRFVTYVVADSEDAATGREESQHSEPEASEGGEMEISRAAVAHVLTYELAQGRMPQEMPHSNPGYDIESVDASGARRFIEVKGIDGPWDEAGVRVSATQFRFAMATGKAAWLYVVEHARDAQRIRLHQIPDPANTATDFCFDLGWQAIASETAREGAAPQLGEEIPEVGDEIEIAGGEIVTVVGVDAGLAITRLTVRSAGGEESFVTWRPGQSGSTSRS